MTAYAANTLSSVDTLFPIGRDLSMFSPKFPMTGDTGVFPEKDRFLDGSRHDLDRRWKGCRGFGRGPRHSSFRKLVAVLAALVLPAFMVSRKRHNLPYVVTGQAILPALKGMRYRWHAGDLADLVAQGTALILPALVALRKGSHLAGVMAGQTILPALQGMRY
jgi:hypothetical protein